MEVQQQHSPAGVGPLDFSRRGVAEASAFRVVKPKQLAQMPQQQQQQAQPQGHGQQEEANNNESLQENTRLPIETEGMCIHSDAIFYPRRRVCTSCDARG